MGGEKKYSWNEISHNESYSRFDGGLIEIQSETALFKTNYVKNYQIKIS